jgi:hypothetical protein
MGDAMKFEEKLWDLSNAITAFVIIQALGFAYWFKGDGFPAQVHCFAVTIEYWIMIAAVLYVSAILALAYFQLRLIEDDPHGIKRSATNLVCGLKIGAILGSSALIYYLTRLAGDASFVCPVH